jgi:hypothetical protein
LRANIANEPEAAEKVDVPTISDVVASIRAHAFARQSTTEA